jgi:hypothetical protein
MRIYTRNDCLGLRRRDGRVELLEDHRNFEVILEAGGYVSWLGGGWVGGFGLWVLIFFWGVVEFVKMSLEINRSDLS